MRSLPADTDWRLCSFWLTRGRSTLLYAVPCQVFGSGVDAAELSPAENVLREAMHPADEFEAFRALVDGGMSETDVAARSASLKPW